MKPLKPLELSLEEIRDFLETRDRLRAKPTKADRARLLACLAYFSALADGRCERLCEQLASVEALAGRLRSEASDHAATW
ncbi:MAG: hypothetical protein ACSLFB_09760 [Acidimicrobiales bacterium]